MQAVQSIRRLWLLPVGLMVLFLAACGGSDDGVAIDDGDTGSVVDSVEADLTGLLVEVHHEPG